MQIAKFLSLFMAVLLAVSAKAQTQGDWYKNNPQSGSYGISLPEANEFLKLVKHKKNPVVAIICPGIDGEHEALKNSLWVNEKEKIDGKGNDKNGYVDDRNGWNFISSADGITMMEAAAKEGNREWFRLKDKYADLYYNGQRFFTIDGDGVENPAPVPQNMQEYDYFRSLLTSGESPLGSTYAGYRATILIKNYVKEWDAYLKEKFPGKSRAEISIEDFEQAIYPVTTEMDSLAEISKTIVGVYTGYMKGLAKRQGVSMAWDKVYENFMGKQIEYSKDNYEKILEKSELGARRQIVGDNYLDIKDVGYGSNQLLTSQSLHGTMMAGIVTGICPHARIMPLVAVTATGEPYLKDIALSIKYAVSNGADVVILPPQNSLYPSAQKRWVYEAIKEAGNKGVLVLAPVWENSEDLNSKAYYPGHNTGEDAPLNNLMVVANSRKDGSPSMWSNYGAGKLDVYAPGENISSAAPGDLYRVGTHTYYGAAVAAGVAALMKAYYPQLTGIQIRDIIVENPTSRKGEEVEKGILIDNGKPSQDLFLFEQLCTAAGIVNAYNAVKSAATLK